MLSESLSRALLPWIARALAVSASVFFASCGGGGDGVVGGVQQPPPAQLFDLETPGQTVTKVRVAGGTVAFLQERLRSLLDPGPQRTLQILQIDGHTLRPYAPPEGWSLIDFAVHPSGEVSAVLTTSKEVRLVRLDRTGSIRSDQPFLDPDAANDPFFDYAGGLRDASSLQPSLMHDAARIAPLGESLALVLRTGLNAIVAYRLDPDATGAYRRSWRTLVEPGSSILGIGITSGSFDTFGQLENHLHIYVDADAADTLAVGVVDAPMFNWTFQAHVQYFGEPISASVGVLLTRLAGSDGSRVGSTVIDTHERAELHGVRATPNGFALVGRVLTEVRSDGTGWDAFATFIGRDGTAGPYSVVNVDQGDVLFDIAAVSGGRYLALGTAGYVQNPSGESISEAAQPLLALLGPDGSLVSRLGFAGGPRQNQLTTVASRDGHWVLGGMVNGPGTHSGDAQRELIVADGFLREIADLAGL